MSDAAAQLGCNRSWIHRLAGRGVLASQPTPYGRLISVASIEAYKQRPVKGPGRPPKR